MKIEVVFYSNNGLDIKKKLSGEEVKPADATSKACAYFIDLINRTDHDCHEPFCYLLGDRTKFVFVDAVDTYMKALKAAIKKYPTAKMTVITEDQDETLVENINLLPGKIQTGTVDFEEMAFYVESVEDVTEWLASLD